ncbi:MAG: hypothetical protein ACK5LJ_08175 [Paracoccus sp. (in: a-proteobacteria)]
MFNGKDVILHATLNRMQRIRLQETLVHMDALATIYRQVNRDATIEQKNRKRNYPIGANQRRRMMIKARKKYFNKQPKNAYRRYPVACFRDLMRSHRKFLKTPKGERGVSIPNAYRKTCINKYLIHVKNNTLYLPKFEYVEITESLDGIMDANIVRVTVYQDGENAKIKLRYHPI